MNHSQIVSFIWGVADLIRDTFKRGKYQDVILPLTVLRRLDCVLAPTRRKVLAVQARFKGRLDNLDPQLRRASGFAFYNTSRYDFGKLLADAPHVAQNLRNYIAGFSPNMREVLERFDFDNTISKLDEAGLLFQVVQRFGDPRVDLATAGPEGACGEGAVGRSGHRADGPDEALPAGRRPGEIAAGAVTSCDIEL